MPSSPVPPERRATVWHCQYRNDALERLKDIPDALKPKVTGEPGRWKVTRIKRPGETTDDVYRGHVA